MGMGGSTKSSMPQGLGPSALANFDIGSAQFQSAIPDIKRYGTEMSHLATGSLMAKGMAQVEQGLSAPSIAPGIQDRTLQRYGVTMPSTTGTELDSQNALRTAASHVGIANNARNSLWDQEMGLQFGG